MPDTVDMPDTVEMRTALWKLVRFYCELPDRSFKVPTDMTVYQQMIWEDAIKALGLDMRPHK